MNYQQLLAAYRQHTGRDVGTADQNNAFNDWVNQQVVASGASSPETIPPNFNFANPQSPINTVNPSTTTTAPAGTLGGLVTPAVATTTPTASVTTVPGSNYNQVQNANQSGTFGTVGMNQQDTTQQQNTSQNTNQTQNTTGNQSTTGTQAQNQTTGSVQNTNNNQTNNQVSNTTGNQTTSGTQAQNTQTGNVTNTGNTGTTASFNQGNTTTGAVDSLGFGGLLKDSAAGVAASDASRRSFLTDTMNTGGSQFGSQIDQAVRNSLSGPGMTGTGDSARARASGYAAAEVGRNNMNQRLAASDQLSGPTGLATLSTAANPYIGSSTNTSNLAGGTSSEAGSSSTSGFSNLLGNTTANTLSNQVQNTTGSTQNIGSTSNSGFSNLLGSSSQDVASNQNTNTTGSMTGVQNTTGTSKGVEASTGSTAAGSSQAASGVVPQGQPVKSGGCVICTAGLELGLFRTPRALRKAALHKVEVETSKYRSALGGYFKVFTPLARWMLRHPKLAAVGMPIAKAVVYEELRIAGHVLPWKFWPWFHHIGWHNTCRVFSLFTKQKHVSDTTILEIARKHNVCFTLKEIV